MADTPRADCGVVLARIDALDFRRRTEAYREEVRAWLRANGVDPNDVTIRRDVEVVLIDGPAIVREEFVRDVDGRVQLELADAGLPYGDVALSVGGGYERQVLARVVHSLLRVPLPDHLADPPL